MQPLLWIKFWWFFHAERSRWSNWNRSAIEITTITEQSTFFSDHSDYSNCNDQMETWGLTDTAANKVQCLINVFAPILALILEWKVHLTKICWGNPAMAQPRSITVNSEETRAPVEGHGTLTMDYKITQKKMENGGNKNYNLLLLPPKTENKTIQIHCFKSQGMQITFCDAKHQQQTSQTSFLLWPHSRRSHSVHWPESPGSFHLCPRRSVHNSCKTVAASWQTISLHTSEHSVLPTGETIQREGTHLGTIQQEQEHRLMISMSGS